MIYKLADGRFLRRSDRNKVLRSNFNVRMKNGVITERRCGRCGEWLDVSVFRISNNNTKISTSCNYCLNEISLNTHFKNNQSRFDSKHRSAFIETRITYDEEGLQMLQCRSCLQSKHLIDFVKANKKIKSRCRECDKNMRRFYLAVGHLKHLFGDNSHEAVRLKRIGWREYSKNPIYTSKQYTKKY